MKYTKYSMLRDLRTLGITSFQWNDTPLRKDVQSRMAGSVAKGEDAGRAEVLEYCWTLYEGALNGDGDQLIGRQKDLGELRTNFYRSISGLGSVANARGVPMSTNFDSNTHANLQQMDKWAKVCNDAWIIGGVHRGAIFRLASPLIIENLWNKNGYFVVTAREIIGLMHFGYTLEQVGPWQCMVPKSPVKSQIADLVIYDKLIKRRETLAQAVELCGTPGMDSNAKAAAQVNAFHQRHAR
ncbi:hypothetical protein [Psychromonas aquimarina]|uniref:hypothetical protein n=1 Tax=Psychromonas aquimarina TaxID=444919 RepID=UPI0004022F79|nr:hypothetical protein [Psychromonas aquimarina]